MQGTIPSAAAARITISIAFLFPEFDNPPGTYKGNQQPVTRTWEVWYAEEIGSDVRIVAHDTDPEAGDQQTDLIDITYGEPDPSIFAPPAGYAIQDARP